VFDRIGGFQDSFRGMFEDQVFFAKVCLRLPVFVSDSCWARYRQHPRSCCAIASSNGSDESARRLFLEWLRSYLVGQNITDPVIWTTLRRQLWKYEHPLLSDAASKGKQLLRRARRKLKRLATTSSPHPGGPNG
jgi:hypothetical protein